MCVYLLKVLTNHIDAGQLADGVLGLNEVRGTRRLPPCVTVQSAPFSELLRSAHLCFAHPRRSRRRCRRRPRWSVSLLRSSARSDPAAFPCPAPRDQRQPPPISCRRRARLEQPPCALRHRPVPAGAPHPELLLLRARRCSAPAAAEAFRIQSSPPISSRRSGDQP